MFISLGSACIIKSVLLELNLTIKERLPFDWCGSNGKFIGDSLKTDFKYWSSPDSFYVASIHKPNNHLHIKNKHGFSGFIHDLDYTHLSSMDGYDTFYDQDGFHGDLAVKEESMNIFIENYQRRIQRLRDLRDKEEKDLYFVFHDYQGIIEDDILNIWIGLNEFCKNKRFTLICIFHHYQILKKNLLNILRMKDQDV